MSCIGTSAAASSAAGTSTGHHTECSRICASSSAARSAANGSAVSSTACTSVPNFAPIGRSAIGDGTAVGAGVGRRRRHRHVADLVVRVSTTSGSLVTPPAVSAARISPEYDVRRHDASMLAVEVPHREIRWRRR